jgi:Bacteriophage HK97-gp10, putative tail-component
MARAPRRRMRQGTTARGLTAAGTTVVGVEQVESVFKALPDELQAELIGDCVSAAAQHMLREQQANVPVGATRTLYDSLRVFRVRQTKNYTRVFVGADKRGYYGRFLEYGYLSRGGAHVPARPWMRPALDTGFQPSVGAFRGTFTKGLGPVAHRLAQEEGALDHG